MKKTNNKTKTITKKKTTNTKKTITKNKKNTKKKLDKVYILLLGIMLLLGIFIIYLLVVLANKTKEVDNKEASIVIPIIELNKSYDIEVELKDLKVGEEYVFKVTNFIEDSINKKEISYNIDVKNESGADFTIYKNESKKDLASQEKEFMIVNNKLKAKEKQTDTYILKLKEKENINNDSKIIINIIS